MAKHTKKNTIQLLTHFVKEYPIRFLIALGALILAGLVETIGIGALLPLLNVVLEINTNDAPNLLNRMINSLFSALGIEQNFKNLLIVIVVTISLKALIIFQAMKTVAYIATDITYDLRQKFIQSIMRAKWNYYSSLNIGHSANAIATEADYAGQFCVLMGKTLSSAIQAGIYISIALAIDWKVSLAAVALGTVAAFILKFLVIMARDAGNDMADILNQLLSRLQEALSGAKPIKAMGKEPEYTHILNNDTTGLQKARKRLALSSLLLNLAHEPILICLMAVGLFWAYSFASYPMSELFMMAFLFNRLLSQVNMVQNHYQKTAIFEGAVNAILEKTATALSQAEEMKGTSPPKLKDNITLNKLSLGYNETAILENLSNKIPANKVTVIFGSSGSGKSTLLDAILGLIPTMAGTIKVDDTDILDIDIQKWRDTIGYVPQETFLFHDTIANNIRLGNPETSEKDIIDALKTANAWEFIKELEDGLHHVVGERGGKLSGGQRQRIALARALVRSPKLLILDEATSGLDKKNEENILQTIKGMLNSMTVILISHDPKILDLADHVIRIEKKQ